MTNTESESQKRKRASLDAIFMEEEGEESGAPAKSALVSATPMREKKNVSEAVNPNGEEKPDPTSMPTDLDEKPTQVLPTLHHADLGKEDGSLSKAVPSKGQCLPSELPSSKASNAEELSPKHQTVSERLRRIERAKQGKRIVSTSKEIPKSNVASVETAPMPLHLAPVTPVKKSNDVTKEKAGEPEKKPNRVKDFLVGWVLPIAGAFAFALFLRHFVGGATTVRGTSMEPTLHDGNVLIVSKLPTYTDHYQRGEIVIIDSPDQVELYVKRLIGLPGDTVHIEDGKVYINDQWMKEYYVSDDTVTYGKNEWNLGPDEYFVMGDNRGEGASNDSRLFGPVSSDQIEAVSRVRIWPITQFQLTQ